MSYSTTRWTPPYRDRQFMDTLNSAWARVNDGSYSVQAGTNDQIARYQQKQAELRSNGFMPKNTMGIIDQIRNPGAFSAPQFSAPRLSTPNAYAPAPTMVQQSVDDYTRNKMSGTSEY